MHADNPTDPDADVVQLAIPRLVFSSARQVAEQVHVPLAMVALERLAPAIDDLVHLRAELAARTVELARQQVEANVDALKDLSETRDVAAMAAIAGDHLLSTMARCGEALQRQV